MELVPRLRLGLLCDPSCGRVDTLDRLLWPGDGHKVHRLFAPEPTSDTATSQGARPDAASFCGTQAGRLHRDVGAFLSPKRLRMTTNHRGTRPFEARRMGLRPSRLPSHAGSAHPGKGQTIRRETVRRIQARSIRAGRRALIIAIWAGQPPILAWYSETADSNCWRPCLVSPRSPPNTYSISARKVEAYPTSSSISALSAFRESVACKRPESHSPPGTGTGRRDIEWMSSSVVRAPSRAELTWSSFSLALVRPGRTRSSSASPTPLRIKRNGHRRGRTRGRPPAPAPGIPAIR